MAKMTIKLFYEKNIFMYPCNEWEDPCESIKQSQKNHMRKQIGLNNKDVKLHFFFFF